MAEALSLIQSNLLTRRGYTPYCGNLKCYMHMPRTSFDGGQFICWCGWRSEFTDDFITQYKEKWKPAWPNSEHKRPSGQKT